MTTIHDDLLAASNQRFVTILRAILAKLDGIKMQVAVQSGFIELDADLASWINEFGGKINVDAAAPQASWIETLIKGLIFLDKPTLLQWDKDLAAPVWGPDGHTISWHLGKLEAEGDPTAHQVCEVLAEVLGAGHCKRAYDGGI